MHIVIDSLQSLIDVNIPAANRRTDGKVVEQLGKLLKMLETALQFAEDIADEL